MVWLQSLRGPSIDESGSSLKPKAMRITIVASYGLGDCIMAPRQGYRTLAYKPNRIVISFAK